MKRYKQLAALALSLLLCAAPAATVHAAHKVPDLEAKDGLITATMTYDGQTVGGGSLTLYLAGEAVEDNGDYYFLLTDEFKGASELLPDNKIIRDEDEKRNISWADLAADLAVHASANSSIEAIRTATIGSNGYVEFSGLSAGLYLIVQKTPADGFEAISPFLVSMPEYDESKGDYDNKVDANPKMGELTKKPAPTTPSGGGSEPSPDSSTDSTPTPAASTSVTPSAPVAPSITPPAMPAVTDPGTLPQTGQLNWPVPVLAAFGLCLIAAGWALRCGGQRKHHGA